MPQKIFTPQERFDFGLSFLLRDEGGYEHDPSDPGGETNFGITQKDLDECHQRLNLPEKVTDLTHDDVAKYYKIMWWDKYNYNAINCLKTATKIFDIAVDIGALTAHKLVQKSLISCGYSSLVIDGILGGKTFYALNECCLHGREEDFMIDFRDEVICYYRTITEENPKLYKFLKGWIVRASSSPSN